MKKQVNIQTTELGQKYFMIYEVRVHVIESDMDWTEDRFMTREAAERDAQLCREIHGNLYDMVWIREQMVWC